MRLQFELKAVKVSPVCHIQLARHAEEFRGRYATGQLYGALYDDEAHITNIMPFPEADCMSTKQELEAMEKRHEQYVNSFNLDNFALGWYMVCYRENFWDSLEAVKYYEKYINTSFFLVYDYNAKQIGANPYQAYRLTDRFALKEEFPLSELASLTLEKENPLEKIPAFVQKDELFEALMSFNKKKFIQQFRQKRSHKKPSDPLGPKFEEYMESMEEQEDMVKKISEKRGKEKQGSMGEYCQFMGVMLKTEQQEESLKKYQSNIKAISKALSQI